MTYRTAQTARPGRRSGAAQRRQSLLWPLLLPPRSHLLHRAIAIGSSRDFFAGCEVTLHTGAYGASHIYHAQARIQRHGRGLRIRHCPGVVGGIRFSAFVERDRLKCVVTVRCTSSADRPATNKNTIVTKMQRTKHQNNDVRARRSLPFSFSFSPTT